MSRAYFTWQEAILRSKLEPTTRLVCHTIGCHMAADGSGCFPSYATISKESGLDRSTIIRHVAKAAEAGFLEVTGRVDKEGDQTSNLYRPVMPEGVVAQDDHGGGTQRPRVVAQRHPNHSTELPIEHTPQPPKGECVRFDEFWEAYPRKVGKLHAGRTWRRLNLVKHADEIVASVKRWKACEQWQNPRFIPHPYTFLNQERWKDTPPAPEQKPGEVRVRETTDEEKREAAERAEFLRLWKLHPGKSQTEIAVMMNQGNDRA